MAFSRFQLTQQSQDLDNRSCEGDSGPSSPPTDGPFLKPMLWEAVTASPTLIDQLGLDQIKEYQKQYWAGWLTQPSTASVTSNGSGVRSGGLLLLPHSETHSWRLGIGMMPQVRRKGVGCKLIDSAVLSAVTQQSSFLNLLVGPTNEAAIRLYEQAAFTPVGEAMACLNAKKPSTIKDKRVIGTTVT